MRIRSFFIFLATALVLLSCGKEKPTGTAMVESVTLNKSEIKLKYNDSYQLLATVHPSDASNKVVHWSTSNPSVATVSDKGLVTAHDNGEATITVRTDLGDFTAECLVIVGSAWVTNLTVSPESISLCLGDKVKINTTTVPAEPDDNRVTFTSSNSSVASVTAVGEVSAKAVGTATITVKALGVKPGSAEVKKEIPVTVSPERVYPTDFSVSLENDEMGKGKQTTYSVTFTPANTTDHALTAEVANPAIVSVDTGNRIVKGLAVGNTTITFSTKKADGTAITKTVTAYVYEGAPSIYITEHPYNPKYMQYGNGTASTAGVLSLCPGESGTVHGEASNTRYTTVKYSFEDGSLSSTYATIDATSGRITCKSGNGPSSVTRLTVKAYSSAKPGIYGTYNIYIWPKTVINTSSLPFSESLTGGNKWIYIKKGQSLNLGNAGSNSRPTFKVLFTDNIKSYISNTKDAQNKGEAGINLQVNSNPTSVVKGYMTYYGLDNSAGQVQVGVCICLYDQDDIKIGDLVGGYVRPNASFSPTQQWADGGWRGEEEVVKVPKAAEGNSGLGALLFYVAGNEVGADDSYIHPHEGGIKHGSVTRHGYAVAAFNASASLQYSQDKDNILESENYPKNYKSIDTKGKYAFDFTRALTTYNANRGNSHDVKPVLGITEFFAESAKRGNTCDYNPREDAYTGWMFPTWDEWQHLGANEVKVINTILAGQGFGDPLPTDGTTAFWMARQNDQNTADTAISNGKSFTRGTDTKSKYHAVRYIRAR